MKFLSIHLGHNYTAGISINGELKFIKSEEQFNRIKNYIGFPRWANFINIINIKSII